MIGNNRIQCDDDPCGAELTYPVEDEPDGFVAGTIEDRTRVYAESKGWLVLPGRVEDHHFCPEHTGSPMARFQPLANQYDVKLSYQHSSPNGRSLIARKGTDARTVTGPDDIRGFGK